MGRYPIRWTLLHLIAPHCSPLYLLLHIAHRMHVHHCHLHYTGVRPRAAARAHRNDNRSPVRSTCRRRLSHSPQKSIPSNGIPPLPDPPSSPTLPTKRPRPHALPGGDACSYIFPLRQTAAHYHGVNHWQGRRWQDLTRCALHAHGR